LHRFLFQRFYFVLLWSTCKDLKKVFSPQSQWDFVGISRNDKEFKDFDESDTKSTVSSGNLRKFLEILQTFDGLFYFPIEFLCLVLSAVSALSPVPRGPQTAEAKRWTTCVNPRKSPAGILAWITAGKIWQAGSSRTLAPAGLVVRCYMVHAQKSKRKNHYQRVPEDLTVTRDAKLLPSTRKRWENGSGRTRNVL
jgi:hypothetical protein